MAQEQQHKHQQQSRQQQHEQEELFRPPIEGCSGPPKNMQGGTFRVARLVRGNERSALRIGL